MDTRKKLVEAKETDEEIKLFMDQCAKQYHPFVERWVKNFPSDTLKEAIGAAGAEPEIGAVVGQTVGDQAAYATRSVVGLTVFKTLEIFNSVIRGFTRYLDDSFVRKYVTDSVIFKIPLVEYRELAADIAVAEFPHTEKLIDYATVDLSGPESEKGAKCTWTRALLEDITFDVQAELMEGLGHAIAVRMNVDIIKCLLGLGWVNGVHQTTALQAAYVAKMPYGALRTISDPITWAQFLAVIGDVDIGIEVDDTAMVGIGDGYDLKTAETFITHKTYGPADFFLCSPEIYWQLLNIIQLTNVLYEGSTDPVKLGRIKLALGVTIIKCGMMPKGVCIALNSEKAVGLVTRRTLKIEPILFPVWNEYGFLGSVRYGVTVLYPGAIQIGCVANTFEAETT
jgi:hypothetical protein